MFSDRTSFLLCVIVSFGFAMAGILDVLDNFVVVTLLLIGFILIIANLFTHDKVQIDEYDKPGTEEEDLDQFNI